jgi:hypothetical protein
LIIDNTVLPLNYKSKRSSKDKRRRNSEVEFDAVTPSRVFDLGNTLAKLSSTTPQPGFHVGELVRDSHEPTGIHGSRLIENVSSPVTYSLDRSKESKETNKLNKYNDIEDLPAIDPAELEGLGIELIDAAEKEFPFDLESRTLISELKSASTMEIQRPMSPIGTRLTSLDTGSGDSLTIRRRTTPKYPPGLGFEPGPKLNLTSKFSVPSSRGYTTIDPQVVNSLNKKFHLGFRTEAASFNTQSPSVTKFLVKRYFLQVKDLRLRKDKACGKWRVKTPSPLRMSVSAFTPLSSFHLNRQELLSLDILTSFHDFSFDFPSF